MALTIAMAAVPAVAGSQLDQQQTLSDGSISPGQLGARQSFTAGKTGTLDKVDLYLGVREGVTAGDLRVSVNTNISSGFPTEIAKAIIPASSFTNDGSLKWVEVPFGSSAPTMIAGQQYDIRLPSSSYLWGNNSAGDYSGGDLQNCWKEVGDEISYPVCRVYGDAAFKTYVTDPPPQTTIYSNSGPSGPVNTTSASFGFYSDEGDSTFECSLDGEPFGACPSPPDQPQNANYSDLSEGSHTFSVKATDSSGNTDPTPANRTWTVDTTAPTVVRVSPANGAWGVSPTADIEATFSEAIDPNSVGVSNFSINNEKDGAFLQGSQVSYDRATKTAILDLPILEACSSYYVAIFALKDLAGNYSEYRGLTFSTALPSVESYTPTQPSGVPRDTRPTATFSTYMDPSTINSRNIKFEVYSTKKKQWISVAHTVGYDAGSRRATVTPGSTLATSKKYRVTVTTTVLSSNGFNLDQNATASGDQPKRWTFTTGT